jgi:GntR family transcriptional regulator of arabinose operon
VEKSSDKPLYIQVQDHILNLVKNGSLKPGESVSSEHDLADQMGISRLTVRKAYAELAKRGILHMVQGKGTFVRDTVDPKQVDSEPGKAKATSRTIGILFPEISIYFAPILEEIENRASEDGMNLNVMFNDSIAKERSAIRQILSQNPAGIILTAYRHKAGVSIENYEELSRSGVPFVMVGKPPFHIHCDSVYVDDVVGVYDTVQTLIGLGHRNFVFLTESAENDLEAMAERSEGLLLGVRTIKDGQSPPTVDLSESGWQRRLAGLLEGADPATAVVADGDRSASSAYNVIMGAGKRIPEDVSVVGYDNSTFCESLQVSLSSVDPRKRLIGSFAYDLLKARMEAEKVDENAVHYRVVKPALVQRNSMGPAPART